MRVRWGVFVKLGINPLGICWFVGEEGWGGECSGI